MIGYIITGALWCMWLEYYTTSRLGAEWTTRERLFNSVLWPVSVTIFIVEFFRNI
jgi:hypothetical protein